MTKPLLRIATWFVAPILSMGVFFAAISFKAGDSVSFQYVHDVRSGYSEAAVKELVATSFLAWQAPCGITGKLVESSPNKIKWVDTIHSTDQFLTPLASGGYSVISGGLVQLNLNSIGEYHKGALQHVLTHEIGHVYGAGHVSDKKSLMNSEYLGEIQGTKNIILCPATLGNVLSRVQDVALNPLQVMQNGAMFWVQHLSLSLGQDK